MSKRIEALKRMPSGFVMYDTKTDIEYTWQELYDAIEKELQVVEILKKYIYYSTKSHCFRMREIRKSTRNFDYETLKEVLINE